MPIQQSAGVGRQGGAGLFSNQALVAAAFSDEVLLEGSNSDVVELSDTQAVVLRVEQFNEAYVLPLEEVEPEIAVLLRTEMEREAVQALGEELLVAVDSGQNLDELIAQNELEWIDAEGTGRTGFSVNQEIVQHVFSMATPEGESLYSGLTLANDTFVLVELNAVNPGDYNALAETNRSTMKTSIQSDLGNNDFSSYLINLRENADISAPLLEEEVF